MLSGPNGAGKTNLLEAMSFLSPGRGLRNARLSDIDRRADAAGAAAGRAGPSPRRSRRGVAPSGSAPAAMATAGERRAVRIDGEPVRGQAALGERLGVLWLTPQMDRLFVEGPEGRRRFLDRLVLGLDPAHAARVGRYEQAMRERSRLLRDGPNDPAWLAALEEMMAAEGVAVAAARREAIERLDRVCAEARRAPFRAPGSALSARSRTGSTTMPALAAEERLRAALAAGRPSDAAVGRRRDRAAPLRSRRRSMPTRDIAAEAASTGEQKALLIAIVLAQARLQRAIAARRRCCCSTRWRRISTRRGAPRCSRRRRARRPGLDDRHRSRPVRAAARRRPLSVGA